MYPEGKVDFKEESDDDSKRQNDTKKIKYWFKFFQVGFCKSSLSKSIF